MSLEALKKGVVKFAEPVPKFFTDSQVSDMTEFLIEEFAPIWFGDNTSSYQEAVSLTNLSTSPGFPWVTYPGCDSKEETLYRHGDKVQADVQKVIAGEAKPMPSTATLKDELRPREKVQDDSTRVFMASGLVHLLASKICFAKQNEKLVKTRGKHPITLGISVPGPEYVTAVLSLGEVGDDSDGSGWDARFHTEIARGIRDVRIHYSDKHLVPCIYNLYDSVYAGYAYVLGVIYWVLGNKSGWENTSTDNSLGMWGKLYLAFRALGMLREQFRERVRMLINGDDLALSISKSLLTFKEVRNWLAEYNVRLELTSEVPKPIFELTFLSHHLMDRYVPGLGDIVVAAGNLPKLKASINWVRPNKTLSFEGSCLVHLLGLRLCLWPWALEFEEIEEIIDGYLARIHITEEIRELLKARISSGAICGLHTRVESAFSIFSAESYQEAPAGDVISLLIKNTELLATLQNYDAFESKEAVSCREKSSVRA